MSTAGTRFIASQSVWKWSIASAIASELISVFSKLTNVIVNAYLSAAAAEIKNAAAKADSQGKRIRLTFYRYDWSPLPFYLKVWAE
jgi:hypothetical protein